MGVDKAGLVVDGETLAVRGGRLLGSECSPAIEVGDGRSGLPSVRERPSGSGPLAALAAAGQALRTRGHDGPALVLAVDLPRVDAPLVRWLRDHPVRRRWCPGRRRLQLVCARYGGDALLAAESLVIGGLRSLRDLLEVVAYDIVDETEMGRVARPDAFADIDTPADATSLGIELPGLA